MPEISVGAQIFDVVFHPTIGTAYVGLLTGQVKGYAYDERGNHKLVFSAQPSKSSCRGLSLNNDGSRLYAVGKGKSLSVIDTATETVDLRARAHDTSINRVKHLMPWLLATGDDDGVVKLWDPRQRESIRQYTHHFDYITDFLWLHDKKQLVSTSGDGTLSIVDVRSKSVKPTAQSEDQEDELLSIVPIKGGAKIAVGTQLGIISIFNPKSGWGDCVDRIPGHPLSVDTMSALPADLPGVDTQSTILTGSSDGLVRAVKILPSKLLGVIADHGEWPIERISVINSRQLLTVDVEDEAENSSVSHHGKGKDNVEDGFQSSGRWWLGSVGHDEILRLTDVEAWFHQLSLKDLEQEDVEEVDTNTAQVRSTLQEQVEDQEGASSSEYPDEAIENTGDTQAESSAKKRSQPQSDDPPPSKRKKKGKKKVIEVEGAFFNEL